MTAIRPNDVNVASKDEMHDCECLFCCPILRNVKQDTTLRRRCRRRTIVSPSHLQADGSFTHSQQPALNLPTLAVAVAVGLVRPQSLGITRKAENSVIFTTQCPFLFYFLYFSYSKTNQSTITFRPSINLSTVFSLPKHDKLCVLLFFYRRRHHHPRRHVSRCG